MNLVERIDALSEEQRKQIIAKTNEDMKDIIRKAKEMENNHGRDKNWWNQSRHHE